MCTLYVVLQSTVNISLITRDGEEVAEGTEATGVLKHMSECRFTWRTCCEERENSTPSLTKNLIKKYKSEVIVI